MVQYTPSTMLSLFIVCFKGKHTKARYTVCNVRYNATTENINDLIVFPLNLLALYSFHDGGILIVYKFYLERLWKGLLGTNLRRIQTV